MIRTTDVLVIGAGAAGLMCAATAAARGLETLVVDHAAKPGKKILASGGGRCNFTNRNVDASHYLCGNPHFVKSALARYSQWDFLELIHRHGIAYHEREHGRLFCDQSAKAIVKLLLEENRQSGAKLALNTQVESVYREGDCFVVQTTLDRIQCRHLVIATGGLSFANLGATGLGYRIAKQFGHRIVPTRPGLVPLKVADPRLADLSGISLTARLTAEEGPAFQEACLFTHRGLSGPAVLQASNYWHASQPLQIDLLPETEIDTYLEAARTEQPGVSLRNTLARLLPRRLVDKLLGELPLDQPLAQLSSDLRQQLVELIHNRAAFPEGSEGFAKAEVTLGGVDTNELSSKTLMSRQVDNLYFIGEVVDVTGWLGGYNFQWAWSSGYCCGQALN